TGLVFALVLRRTGSLWLGVGWPAAFDFGASFLFFVADTGFVFCQHLSFAVVSSKYWLTACSVGPEAYGFGYLPMAIAALLVQLPFPAKKRAAGEPQTPTAA